MPGLIRQLFSDHIFHPPRWRSSFAPRNLGQYCPEWFTHTQDFLQQFITHIFCMDPFERKLKSADLVREEMHCRVRIEILQAFGDRGT